jgi:hypothetical protein
MNVSVPDAPHFDPDSAPYFLERLGRASEYLEYGSGGSTVEAARRDKKFTTVESDPDFLKAVEQKIGSSTQGRLIHVNIGKTCEWGAPAAKRWRPWRRWLWSRYAAAPWKLQINPDLVLIDGRFRVHCALYSIRQLAGRDFEILFDDYAERPFYHEVERFASLDGMFGRMARFAPKRFEKEEINDAIRRYETDWR